MSKKKTRSKVEKATVRHNFTHLKSQKVFQVKSDSSVADQPIQRKEDLSPQNKYIAKDLKLTSILIGSFIIGIAILGIIVYKTGLLSPLFGQFGIKY